MWQLSVLGLAWHILRLSMPRESFQAVGLRYLQNSAWNINRFPERVPKIFLDFQTMEDCTEFFIPFWSDKSRKQPPVNSLTKSGSQLRFASDMEFVCLIPITKAAIQMGSCYSPSSGMLPSLLPLPRPSPSSFLYPDQGPREMSAALPGKPLPCRCLLSVPALLSTKQFRD